MLLLLPAGQCRNCRNGENTFVIIDAECAGQYGTQCGEVGEKGKILFTITFLFEDTFVQQIGQIFVHALGKQGVSFLNSSPCQYASSAS